MSERAAQLIADRYISRDGQAVKRAGPGQRELTGKQEAIVLDALRQIAKGQPWQPGKSRRPLTGKDAQGIARRAMADVMQPVT